MLIIFQLLLLVRVGRCEDDLNFETNTVVVGEDVTLNCTRLETDYEATLFWIRLGSGKPPDVLGGTFAFDYLSVKETSHITAKQEPGTYVLQISHAKLNDTGLYYCIKVDQLNMIFRKGVFLQVTGLKPDVTAIIQNHLPDPVVPGDSVGLQCSVLYDFKNKACPAAHSVYWFRSGSDKSYPSIIYTHGTRGNECETGRETRSPQSCVYSFTKNISSSDAGTYHCAVATCGHILFGTGTKLDDYQYNMLSLQTITVLGLLSTTLAISLIVILFLIYAIKKKTCESCNVSVKTDAATFRDEQRGEDSLTYSALTFRGKAEKTERKNATTAGETVYTDVKSVVI